MDKIYEEKGKFLEKAFAELPLDVSLNMRGLSNLLNTTPEAIFCLAITQGMVKAWDYAGGDFEEALQPIQIDAKCNFLAKFIGHNFDVNYSVLNVSYDCKDEFGKKERGTWNFKIPSVVSDEKIDAFANKEVTITIALKGGQE